MTTTTQSAGNRRTIATTGTATVTITVVNDAPVLDNFTGTMTMTSITEDQANNAGQTIASIIASAGR